VVLNRVINAIKKVWELKFANGKMKEMRESGINIETGAYSLFMCVSRMLMY